MVNLLEKNERSNIDLKKNLNKIIFFEGFLGFFMAIVIGCIIGLIITPFALSQADLSLIILNVSLFISVLSIAVWGISYLYHIVRESYNEIVQKYGIKEEFSPENKNFFLFPREAPPKL